MNGNVTLMPRMPEAGRDFSVGLSDSMMTSSEGLPMTPETGRASEGTLTPPMSPHQTFAEFSPPVPSPRRAKGRRADEWYPLKWRRSSCIVIAKYIFIYILNCAFTYKTLMCNVVTCIHVFRVKHGCLSGIYNLAEAGKYILCKKLCECSISFILAYV